MAKVIPFKGYRYNTQKFANLDDVTAPPYDIISLDDRQKLYDKSEYNIVRVDYGMDYDTDDEKFNRYTRAEDNITKWINDGVLVKDDSPAIYIYEQIFSLNDGKPAHSLKGFISLVQLKEFSEKVILPHEETIKNAKKDRLDLMRATGANISPVYSLYNDDEEKIARLIEENSDRDPDVTFMSADNVRQNLWVVKDQKVINDITTRFDDKQLFIADGHHRYETALNYRNERHKADGTQVGTADYDYVMMMLVSMSNSGLFVFPTHRLVKNVERFDESLLVGFLTEDFAAAKIHFTEGDYASIITERLANTVDEKLFALYTGGNYYYLLKLKDLDLADKAASDGMSHALARLDVTVLHKLILEKHLGIDTENMAEQISLDYTRDAAEAVKAVQKGEYQCAFLINPTKVSEIRDVALADEKMPQKSTYFLPKLVTGIVLNRFDK